jgi:bla regulator protein blaR1
MVFTLARASMDGALLVVAIWAAIWLLDRVLRLSPATRATLWWCAAAKFVVALTWTTPVAIPILPAEQSAVYRAVGEGASPRVEQLSLRSDRPAQVQRAATAGLRGALREWSTFAAIGWTMGLVIVGVVGVRRWRDTVRLRDASSAANGALQGHAAELAARLRLRHVPEVRISTAVETPLVTGLLRPVVLLPANRFEELTDRQQQMAICHELAHVKRADLWLGCVPALAERLFFFHPLVRLASREYALSREAACDSTVIDTLEVAPQDYGRLLLALGVSRPQTGLTAAGAAWSFANLKRRIAMLQNDSARSTKSRILAVAVVGLAVAALVPMQLAARRGSESQTGQAAPKLKPPAASQSQPRERVTPAPTSQGERQQPSGRSDQKSGELNFVLLLEDNQQTMSGSLADVARARRHQKNGEPLLWFRADGQEYVVRDRDLIAQARALWNDVYESSFDHAEIAAAAQALSAEALEHGLAAAEQGMKSAHLGGLAAEQAIRALTDAHLSMPEIDIRADLESAREQLEQSLPDVEEALRELEQRLKSDLDDQIRDLRQRLRALEEPTRKKDAALSHELQNRVNAFGARVGESARQASEKMRELVERARSAGLAVTVR